MPQEQSRLQQTSKEKQASLLKSDGGPRGEFLQRSHSASAPLEVALRILESTIEGADGLRTHQVPPKGVSSLPRKTDLSSASAGLGRSSETLEAAAAKQLEREDLFAARAKAPRMRGTQHKNSISSVTTPSLQTLIAQPGSGTGVASPDGEASQGPLPINYNLEIEADFPKGLVLTMQENAAKKASVPELKPDSPSQMLSKHLENFHKTKAKLNFGFRNADNSQVTQPATSTNPFAALEADNPEAEDAMDNPEEMKEGLPLSIRITGLPKEEWTHATALANITQSIESKLEDKILNAISVQNKRHLHWRLSDSLTGMNNDIEFSGSAHNLLLKSDPVSIDRQACKSETANQLASPQAIRKKRFTKLDLSKLEPQRVVTFPNFKVGQTVQGVDQEKAG
ncbi:unnamed protein product [Sphagnum jensenii]